MPAAAAAPPQAPAADSAADAGRRKKKLRNLQKLLRAIEQLAVSAEAGQELDAAQQAKLDRRAEVQAEIAELQALS